MSIVAGRHIAVVGASLGGLSAANVLHGLGAIVTVFECFERGFDSRGGALGAVDVQLLRSIRNDDGSQGYKSVRGHGHFYGDLWRYLYDGLPEGSVLFGKEVLSVDQSDPKEPRLAFTEKGETKPQWRSFDAIIGADGGKSTIRQYVTASTPKYSGYTLWRGLCPVEGVAGPPSGGRQINGVRYETLGFPVRIPRGEMWICGVYMAMPEAEVEPPVRNRQIGAAAMKTVPGWFVPFTRKLFGESNAQFWSDCVQRGKVTPHAVWELACDRVVKDRVVLLGDAAHMASPRTGAGAYTAMVDAVVLGQAMEQAGSLDEAFSLYNDDTVERGEALYRRSRQAASYFAPEKATIISPQVVLASLQT